MVRENVEFRLFRVSFFKCEKFNRSKCGYVRFVHRHTTAWVNEFNQLVHRNKIRQFPPLDNFKNWQIHIRFCRIVTMPFLLLINCLYSNSCSRLGWVKGMNENSLIWTYLLSIRVESILSLLFNHDFSNRFRRINSVKMKHAINADKQICCSNYRLHRAETGVQCTAYSAHVWVGTIRLEWSFIVASLKSNKSKCRIAMDSPQICSNMNWSIVNIVWYENRIWYTTSVWYSLQYARHPSSYFEHEMSKDTETFQRQHVNRITHTHSTHIVHNN